MGHLPTFRIVALFHYLEQILESVGSETESTQRIGLVFLHVASVGTQPAKGSIAREEFAETSKGHGVQQLGPVMSPAEK